MNTTNAIREKHTSPDDPMDINITKYFKNPPESPVYGSVAQYGKDAGTFTFNNAKEHAASCDLLDTPEKVEAFKKYVKSAGDWSREEIESWSHDELVALFVQFIAADMSDNGPLEDRDDDNGGEVFLGDDGEYYYTAEA